MKTLEQILEEEKSRPDQRNLNYFKREVLELISYDEQGRQKKTRDELLFELLRVYVYRAKYDPLFNPMRVLAVWEILNGRENLDEA